jgi:hypothetical protein
MLNRMIIMAALLLLTPDMALAQARGLSPRDGPAPQFGGALRPGSRESPRVGLSPTGGWRGQAAVPSVTLRQRQAGWGLGSVLVVNDPAFYGIDPDCELVRVQINDEYGWRVRSRVVCP